mmetsp:Transcript_11032/g.16140  ORF Transcript_11032/g.16140 Transcript_11032/m.16140 type:complete len:268 (+) Transcript_11032:5907-6710(+)|eukprot:CAMPEP_0195507124 /NCGR_PEP_ID=MMETSP0794_2-20130614/625_1 /TAXON_ID=515487 /ORGANISM="Stephanopyxis turris, Strain CCMP 815" /LENGTH=267 /DNA_ID=CAMNT_0040633689 /DNA_START=1416 /DNA_END=2219 /DNA_ORIENTATION=+
MNKVEIKRKTDMSEVDLIIHILSNLPEDYGVLVSELEEKLKDTSHSLEIGTVCEKLNSRFEQLSKHAEVKEEEKALAAFKKQFKGRFTNCGEYGHKSSKCPKNSGKKKEGRKSGNKFFNGKCNYCRKYRHKAEDCRSKKQDQEERKGEKSKAAVEEESDESVCKLSFMIRTQNEKAVYSDKKGMYCKINGTSYLSFTEDTAYGDSRSSCHLHTSDEGMYNIKEIDKIIDGIGTNIQATKKVKMQVLVKQVDGLNTIWVLQVKYCKEA